LNGAQSRRRIRLAAGLALGLGLALAAAGAAEARSVTVRWRFSAPERAAGFRVHLGPRPGVYTHTIDVGKPAPDGDGVFRVSIEVPDHEPVFLAVSAYGERGEESARSNEGVRAPGPADADGGAAQRLGTPGQPRVVRP
jgi:hypothetical protein